MKTGDKVTIEGTVIDVVNLEADIDNILISDGEHEMWVRSDFIAETDSVPEPVIEDEPSEDTKKSPAKKVAAKK